MSYCIEYVREHLAPNNKFLIHPTTRKEVNLPSVLWTGKRSVMDISYFARKARKNLANHSMRAIACFLDDNGYNLVLAVNAAMNPTPVCVLVVTDANQIVEVVEEVKNLRLWS